MNSKEALDKLVGKTTIMNDTCASLEDCIKGCKCRFNEPKETCEDYKLFMIINQDLDRLKKLEKELKQTKLNFKNSQTHSKNYYKKLKEKYEKLERAYKNNEVLVRDLNELINRNLELKKVRDNYSDQLNYVWNIVNSLKDENTKLKQAIKILKDFFIIHQKNGDYLITATGFDKLSQMDYKLLKQVFESVGDSDE
jgi:DNA repair ATPase RecN